MFFFQLFVHMVCHRHYVGNNHFGAMLDWLREVLPRTGSTVCATGTMYSIPNGMRARAPVRHERVYVQY